MWHIRQVCIACVVVISTACILAAPSKASETKFVFVPQADSPGNDYLRVDHTSLGACERNCEAQSACNAFTYNQLHGVCFLKHSVNQFTTFYAFAVTGIKLSPSTQSTNVGENESVDSRHYFLLIPQADSPWKRLRQD